MGNRVEFVFNLNEEFNIEKYKKVIKLVSKEKFNERKIEYSKGYFECYYYNYIDEKNDISIAFYWYYKKNEFLFFAPDFSYAPPYCINLIKKIYPLLKAGGWGNTTEAMGYKREEYELMKDARTRGKELRIWSINLFAPSEVQKYGREKLLKAPCEVIEEWEDGAIFMMIHRDKFSSTYEERKKLREYFYKAK